MGLLDDILGLGGRVASGAGSNINENRNQANEYQRYLFPSMANVYGTQVGAQSNLYNTQANQQTSQYNTNQQALLQALLGSSNEGQQNAQLDLLRRKFALDAPSTRAGQAARGSILQNLQPATSSGGSARLRAATPTISGGYSPSALGPGAREAGRLLESGALEGLRKGDTFDPLPKTDFQGGVLKPPGILAAPGAITPPTFPAYQGPGTGESLLGLLGGLLSGGRGGTGAGGTGGSGAGGDIGSIIRGLIGAFRNRGGGGAQGPPLPPGLVEGDFDWGDLGDGGPIGETGATYLPEYPDIFGQGSEWGNWGGGGWPEVNYGPSPGSFEPDDELGWG